jgi:regulator of sigma E protease
MENIERHDTAGTLQWVDAKYELLPRGAYVFNRGAYQPVQLEGKGALQLAEARNADEIARAAGADRYAADTLARARAATYRGQPIWKRVTILSMGVVVNIIAAILILTAALSLIGIPTPTLRVAAVTAGGAAETAGVRVGDTVVSLDGRAITKWAQLKAALGRTAPGQPLELGVRRSGSTVTLRVVPTASTDGTGAVLGVMAGQTNVPMPVASAAGESLSMTGQVFLAVVKFFDPKTFGSSLKDARSVVGISYEVASAAEQGPLAYAWMVALLSLSLGVMNILPIPPLDGGKIVLEFIEAIAHRPVPRKLALALSAAGTLLLFSLIFYLMYADVLRYVVPKG